MNFLRLIIAMLASFGLYYLVFNTAIARPMTRGTIFEMLDRKLAHAQASQEPQLFFMAGSNARYSHSCAVLSAELARPCTNMGIAAGVGIDMQLSALGGVVQPGDTIYMPLEYNQYSVVGSAVMFSAETGEWFRRDKAGLYEARGPEGVLKAFFHFDISYGAQSVFEMLFQAIGGTRRVGLQTMNEMGDEVGHTLEKSEPYREVLAKKEWAAPVRGETLIADAQPGDAQSRIAAFVATMAQNDVTVIGGLPTTFDDMPIPDDLIEGLRALFTENGGQFIALDNRSQYPRAEFHDTHYHLNETAAAAHTRRVAAALRTMIDE